MSKETKKEVNPRVKAIAEVMKKHLVEDDDKLKINQDYLKEVFTEACLKEGSTMSIKAFKEAKDHEEAIIASAKWVLAEKAMENMAEDEELDKVYGDVKIVNDRYEVMTYRSRNFINPKTGEHFEKKGHVQPYFRKRGSKKSAYTTSVNVELVDVADRLLK